MQKIPKCIILSFFLSVLFTASYAQTSYDAVINRYKDWMIAHEQLLSDSITKWQNTIAADGTWPDIDYENKSSSVWKTVKHLDRTKSLLCAWVDSSNTPFQHEKLWNTIGMAIDHWLRKKYVNPNWWYNEIGAPQFWRDILALGGKHFNEERFKGMLALLQKYYVRPNFTGANLNWSADLMLHDGLLTHDEKKVLKARLLLVSEVKVSILEGIQPDYSFHQHGARLQAHSYGGAFLTNNIRLAWELDKSPWAFPSGKVDTITAYVLNGWQWMARGINNVPGTVDRAISRVDKLQSADLRSYLPYLISIERVRRKELTQMLATQNGSDQLISGLRQFPFSDFTALQRKGFSFFVKTISTRTEPTENINQENKKGNLLNFGDTYLVKTGEEYFNLMPVWDWKKLPGQTLVNPLMSSIRLSFTGGLSDGQAGLTAMDLRLSGSRSMSTIHKMWAFYKGSIVTLISGMVPGTDTFYTTLNQSRWQGDVSVNSVGHILKDGSNPLSDFKWLHHAGFVYLPFSKQPIDINLRTATGTWSSLTGSGLPDTIAEQVFMPVVYHHKDSSYAYLTAEAPTAAKASEIAEHPGCRVLLNNAACQAVAFGEHAWMLALHTGTQNLAITGKLTVSADKPCLLMIQGNSLHIADPTHTGGTWIIVINKKRLSISLPADGSTITRKISS